MSAPRDLGPDFRSWLRDVPPTPDDLSARALEKTRRTRQRRRWLWSLPGPKPTAGAEGGADHALRPRLPNVTQERTTTMFSTAKLIGITASIALAGALALALPASQPGEPAPAAEPATTEPELTPFSGWLIVRSTDRYGDVESHAWGDVVTDQEWTFEYDLDDDRLDGMGRSRVTDHLITGFAAGPKSFTVYIENDGGSWVGQGRAYDGVGGGGWHHQTVLAGQGGYEGLTAILSADQQAKSGFLDVEGVLFTGGLPALPDPAPTEFE
jgi:hypothetical protein